ncbi:MAG: tetratricopeptide repeat protein [Pseudomonadota bacterium]
MRRVFVLLTALFFAASVQAHLPEYFGRRFVLMSDSPEEPPAEDCGGDPAERERKRRLAEDLENELGDMQRDQGAYSPLLADPAGELAELHASLCNHPAALDASRRAVQALRINEGLLSAAQLPYLRSMAKSYAAIGDYESSQRTLRYSFRVFEMGRGSLTAEALRESMAYFARAREIFIDPRSPQELGLFYEAYADNRSMFEAQWERFAAGEGPSYAFMKTIALSHLHNLYLILGTDLSQYSMANGDAGSRGAEFMQRSQLLTYARGKELIEDLLATRTGSVGAEAAEWKLRLGNWQQWNGKWQSACSSYADAWTLAEGEAGAALRGRMASPAELPEDEALWIYLRGRGIPVRDVIEASFSVSARGIISRVDGGSVRESGSGGRLLRWLRDSHARPAVRDGRCVGGELQGRRYHLVD